MSWRVKQFLRKWTPIALMVAVGWVGFTHYQRGGRANFSSVMTSAKVAAARVPVFGSYLRGRSNRSYYTAYRSGKRYGHVRHTRRGKAHHRRGRRHRR